jgi:hypothetical protein
MGEITEEEKGILEEKIIECYKNKGITFDDKTLYHKAESENVNIKEQFVSDEQMPILEDLDKLLEKDERTVTIHNKLLPFVKGSLNFFNKHTNVKLENKLIIADV